MRLHNNSLWGALPGELGDLAKLRYLHLHGNDLNGPVPDSMGKLNLDVLRADTGLLCRTSALTRAPWKPNLAVCLSPAEAPAAPDRPVLTPDDRQITVHWSTPHPNGATITGYSIRYRAATSSTWTPWAHTGLNTSTTITGLTNSTDYHIQTAAANSAGTGSWSPSAIGQANNNRQALIALYDNNGGAGWKNRTNWKTLKPIKHWHGVTTNDNGRVTGLDLSDNNLTGAIPAQLGSLARLTTLDLSDNNLTGAIPAQLGNPARLTTLNLSDNNLTGAIPAQLGNPARLTTLDLSDNRLSGAIPSTLGGLTRLRYLYLADNGLTGPVPLTLRNPTLHGLSADNGRLCRPPALTKNPWGSKLDACQPPATAPDTPAPPDPTPGHKQLTLHWDAPNSNSATIDDYDIEYRTTPNGAWTAWPHTDHTITNTITGLTNTNSYQTRIRATNTAGTSPWTAPSTTVHPYHFGDKKALTAIYNTTHKKTTGYTRYRGTRKLLASWDSYADPYTNDECYWGTKPPSGPTKPCKYKYTSYEYSIGTRGERFRQRWLKSDNWGTDLPLSRWHGVTLDTNGRVSHLNLADNNIWGPLPADLGGLTDDGLSQLTHLNLANNTRLALKQRPASNTSTWKLARPPHLDRQPNQPHPPQPRQQRLDLNPRHHQQTHQTDIPQPLRQNTLDTPNKHKI